MTNHHTIKVAATAMLAAAALGGCGKSDDATATSAPATSAAAPPVASSPATTPVSTADAAKAQWANQLCSTLVTKAKPVQPPSVAASTPEATQKSLETFFTSVVSTQTIQLQTLKSIGEPPSKNAVDDWKAAIKKLRSIRRQVSKVESDLEKTPATNSAEIAKVIATLGKQTKLLASYDGPVADLGKNKAIGPALQAEAACSQLL